jgi:hypothetical protein
MLSTLFKRFLVWDPGSPVSSWGHLILRVSAGLMLFCIHGWPKLEGGIAYLQHGTPWKLVEAIAQAACDPSQNGLLLDLPHRHNVTRFRTS